MARPTKGRSPWVTTAQALRELGISADHLYRHRKEWMRRERHWKNIALPSSLRATYRWHLTNIKRDWPTADWADPDSGKSPETSGHAADP